MGDNQRKVMKDINLNDLISVTLPAHVWLGFIGAYGSTKWESADANIIGEELVDLLFDPVLVKERQAAMQEHRDMHQGIMRAIFSGRPPGMDGDDPRMEKE